MEIQLINMSIFIAASCIAMVSEKKLETQKAWESTHPVTITFISNSDRYTFFYCKWCTSSESIFWWHISAITCQIIRLTCQIFMLTCQLFMLTCQIIMSTCLKISSQLVAKYLIFISCWCPCHLLVSLISDKST